MFFNSYVMTKHQKRDLIDTFYQKIVNVSRNKVFYTKLKIPDTIDGRYDLLALFSIILTFALSRSGLKGVELSQILFDKIFLDLNLSLRELGAGDVGVNIKIKDMIRSYMGRQKAYCACFEKDNYIKLEKSVIRNIYRNVDKYDNEPKLLVKYCEKCIEKFKNKQIEYFISNKFDFPKTDNFFE